MRAGDKLANMEAREAARMDAFRVAVRKEHWGVGIDQGWYCWAVLVLVLVLALMYVLGQYYWQCSTQHQ